MKTELQSKLDELRADYDFNSAGIIINPGKFEGESIATLYLYDCMMNGAGAVMELSEEEKKAFDIESDFVYVAGSNDGFVHCEYYKTLEEAEEREAEETGQEYTDLDSNELCPICGGYGYKMGALGSSIWYRCESCGIEFEV